MYKATDTPVTTIVRMNRAAFDAAREERTGYCYGCGAEQHGIGPDEGPRARDVGRPTGESSGGPECRRCGVAAVAGVDRARREGWLIVERDQVAA